MNRKLAWVNPADPLPPSTEAFTAEEGANGLLAAGMDLSPQRLMESYRRGIFPWFSQGEPVLWWTPDPRMVLMLADFSVSKSFRKTLRRALQDDGLTIVCNHDFAGVMRACAAPRGQQAGTWINPAMVAAYAELHAQGFAHSVALLRHGEPVGGLYCVSIGRMVFGESMFSRESEASKIALAALVAWLQHHGALVIDCQQRTAHLASLGGREIVRSAFESLVVQQTALPDLPWATDPVAKPSLAQWC